MPKSAFATRDFYDVWLPDLAPSEALVKQGLAALSLTSNFSVGCYCEDESRCHRSVLRELLKEHGAAFA